MSLHLSGEASPLQGNENVSRTDEAIPQTEHAPLWRKRSLIAATVLVVMGSLAVALLHSSSSASPSMAVSAFDPASFSSSSSDSITVIPAFDPASFQSSSSMVNFKACPDAAKNTSVVSGSQDFTFDHGAGIYEVSLLDSPDGASYVRSVVWISQLSPSEPILEYNVVTEGETGIYPSTYIQVNEQEATSNVIRVMSLFRSVTVEISYLCSSLGQLASSNLGVFPGNVIKAKILSGFETLGVIPQSRIGSKVIVQAGSWPIVVSVEGVSLHDLATLGFGMRFSSNSDYWLRTYQMHSAFPESANFYIARH